MDEISLSFFLYAGRFQVSSVYVHWRRYWSDAFRVGSEVHMVRFTKLSLEND